MNRAAGIRGRGYPPHFSFQQFRQSSFLLFAEVFSHFPVMPVGGIGVADHVWRVTVVDTSLNDFARLRVVGAVGSINRLAANVTRFHFRISGVFGFRRVVIRPRYQ